MKITKTDRSNADKKPLTIVELADAGPYLARARDWVQPETTDAEIEAMASDLETELRTTGIRLGLVISHDLYMLRERKSLTAWMESNVGELVRTENDGVQVWSAISDTCYGRYRLTWRIAPDVDVETNDWTDVDKIELIDEAA